MKAKISVKFTQPLAEIVHNALQPDNKPLPKDISLKSEWKNKKIDFYIEYNGNNPLRLFSTIDELLEAISLTLRTIDTIKSFKSD